MDFHHQHQDQILLGFALHFAEKFTHTIPILVVLFVWLLLLLLYTLHCCCWISSALLCILAAELLILYTVCGMLNCNILWADGIIRLTPLFGLGCSALLCSAMRISINLMLQRCAVLPTIQYQHLFFRLCVFSLLEIYILIQQIFITHWIFDQINGTSFSFIESNSLKIY